MAIGNIIELGEIALELHRLKRPNQPVGDSVFDGLRYIGAMAVQNPDFSAQLRNHRDDPNYAEDFRFCAILTHWGMRWIEDGRPRFRLSHGLYANSTLTHFNGLNTGEFRLPFRSFLIDLPELIHFSGPNGPVATDQIMVSSWTMPSISADTSKWNLGDPDSWPDIGEDWEQAMHIGIRGGTQCDLWHWNRCPKNLGGLEALVYKAGGFEGLEFDKDRSALGLAARIVSNVCLYLEMVGGRKSMTDRPLGAPPSVKLPTYFLGKEIHVSQEMRKAAKDLSSGDEQRRLGWKLNSRFIVRGHWTHQPCGEGRRDRKLTWITPYWKGPSLAPVVPRNYVLEGEG